MKKTLLTGLALLVMTTSVHGKDRFYRYLVGNEFDVSILGSELVNKSEPFTKYFDCDGDNKVDSIYWDSPKGNELIIKKGPSCNEEIKKKIIPIYLG